MSHAVRLARVGALLLPLLAACPQPPAQIPGPPAPGTQQNLLVPGQPHPKNSVEFRQQMQAYLERGPATEDTGRARAALLASLNFGPPVPGVNFDEQTTKCGGGGCWIAVHYQSSSLIEAFDKKVLTGEGAPFHKWVAGAGRAADEPEGSGVSVVWFFINPRRAP